MYCKNCGNEIPEGAAFCKQCGAPVPVTRATPARPAAPVMATPVRPAAPAMRPAYAQPAPSANAKPKRGLIIGATAIAAIVAIVLVVVLVAMPTMTTNKGKEQLENQDWSGAITTLTSVNTDEAKGYLQYATTMSNFRGSDDDYKAIDAAATLAPEVKDLMCDYLISEGDQKMSEEKFDNAYTLYTKACSYGDAQEKATYAHNVSQFLKAESSYTSWDCTLEAYEIYTSLPDDFEYNGVKAADRVAQMEPFAAAIKQYCVSSSSNTNAKLYSVSSSRFENKKKYDTSKSDVKVYSQTKFNEDGTLTIRFSADFKSFSSSTGTGRTTRCASVEKTITAGEDVSSSITLNQSTNSSYKCSVTYSNGSGTFTYSNTGYTDYGTIHFS